MSASAGITAFTAAAATVGGVAAMSVGSMIVAGLQVVGGITSALGAVTGNEKLMKVGMVASLGASAVSGLSGLASGATDAAASGAGAAESVMGSAAPAGDYAAYAAKVHGTGDALVKNIGGAADALTGPSVADITRSAAGGASAFDKVLAGAPGEGAGAGAGGGAGGEAAGNGMLNSVSKYSLENGVKPSLGVRMPGPTPLDYAPAAGNAPPSSIFSKVGSFVNANAEMTKLGMGMLGGFGQAYSEKEKLKAAERMDAAKRKRLNDSIVGIQSAF